MVFTVVVGQLQQGEPGISGIAKGLRPLGKLLAQQGQAIGRKQLECGQACPEPGTGVGQETYRLGQRLEGQKCGEPGLRQREQLQGRGRDNAQRAFTADEQIAQVIAGIVLAQTTQSFPDFALSRDHFKPQSQFAGIAIAQHGVATGIGAQVAANGATALRAQTQREQAVGLASLVLKVLQDATGFDSQSVVVGIDLAHTVHAFQQQQNRLAAGIRGCSAHQPGVTALHHHGRSMGDTQTHHRGNLFGIRRTHDRRHLSDIATLSVGQALAGLLAGLHMTGTQQLLQCLEQPVTHGVTASGAAFRYCSCRSCKAWEGAMPVRLPSSISQPLRCQSRTIASRRA
ncbi:hypothetical protein ALQ47_05258 [Pseudomonas cichorii]|nr:hypothetical protein ALQ47_05258 [Pseudomonas cichorii]